MQHPVLDVWFQILTELLSAKLVTLNKSLYLFLQFFPSRFPEAAPASPCTWQLRQGTVSDSVCNIDGSCRGQETLQQHHGVTLPATSSQEPEPQKKSSLGLKPALSPEI